MADFDPRKSSADKDKDLDGIIRPQELEDFTGQREIVSNLRIYIQAAKMRGEALGSPCRGECSSWYTSRSGGQDLHHRLEHRTFV